MRKGIALLTIALSIITTPVYASSLQDMKPSGGADPNKNIYQYEDGSSPTADELMKNAKKAEETVNDSYWDINERDVVIHLDLNKGTTRFEVFYTANGAVPYVAFMTPDGDIYEAGKDTDNIVARPNNVIEGHSDLRYEVIYVTSPSSTNDIKAKISLDSKTRDFMLIQSTVPPKWQTFREEFRTNPENLIIWGFHNSENNISDLIAIAENVDFNPAENKTENAAPPVIKRPSLNGFIIAVMVMAIIGIGMLLFFNNMDKKHKEASDKEKRIKKMNRQAKKNRLEHEKTLDSALDEFDDDYSDDDFFKENPVGDDAIMPLEEKVAFRDVEERDEFVRSSAVAAAALREEKDAEEEKKKAAQAKASKVDKIEEEVKPAPTPAPKPAPKPQKPKKVEEEPISKPIAAWAETTPKPEQKPKPSTLIPEDDPDEDPLAPSTTPSWMAL